MQTDFSFVGPQARSRDILYTGVGTLRRSKFESLSFSPQTVYFVFRGFIMVVGALNFRISLSLSLSLRSQNILYIGGLLWAWGRSIFEFLSPYQQICLMSFSHCCKKEPPQYALSFGSVSINKIFFDFPKVRKKNNSKIIKGDAIWSKWAPHPLPDCRPVDLEKFSVFQSVHKRVLQLVMC